MRPISSEFGISIFFTLPLPLLRCFFYREYLLGASLGADSAGYTLGRSGGVFRADQHFKGTGLKALAAVDAGLLVEHINPVGVLGDCPGLAGFGAFAALDAERNCGFTLFFPNLNTRKPDIVVLVKRAGAGQFTGPASHAGSLIGYR
jgi:hypothetical protein